MGSGVVVVTRVITTIDIGPIVTVITVVAVVLLSALAQVVGDDGRKDWTVGTIRGHHNGHGAAVAGSLFIVVHLGDDDRAGVRTGWQGEVERDEVIARLRPRPQREAIDLDVDDVIGVDVNDDQDGGDSTAQLGRIATGAKRSDEHR